MNEKVRAVDFFGTPILLPTKNKEWAELEERLRVVIAQEIRAGFQDLESKIAKLGQNLVKIDFRVQAIETIEAHFVRLNEAFHVTMSNQRDLIDAIALLPYGVRDAVWAPKNLDEGPAADDTPPPLA